MNKEELKFIADKFLVVIFIGALLTYSIIYLNSRWERIRDIRRTADAQSIIKALDFYSVQFGKYPDNTDDDGDGWDKTNDSENRKFLESLTKIGLLSQLIFDPKNDQTHYYRYQKFAGGSFGCPRAFAVFQIASFEARNENYGTGRCPKLDWTSLAPYGFTWFALD